MEAAPSSTREASAPGCAYHPPEPPASGSNPAPVVPRLRSRVVMLRDTLLLREPTRLPEVRRRERLVQNRGPDARHGRERLLGGTNCCRFPDASCLLLLEPLGCDHAERVRDVYRAARPRQLRPNGWLRCDRRIHRESCVVRDCVVSPASGDAAHDVPRRRRVHQRANCR